MAKTEFQERLHAANRQFDAVKTELREIYAYCWNGREREFDSARAKKWSEAEEIFHDTTADLALDFAADLAQYTTPENETWLKLEAGADIPEADVEGVKAFLSEYLDLMENEIRGSNYYEVQSQIFGDFAAGTAACWIDRPIISEAVMVEPVALPQIRVVSGVKGIEDRFRVKKVWSRDVPLLFPEMEMSRKLREKVKDTSATCVVTWGFWRDYGDPANPQWMRCYAVDGEESQIERLGPEGSCPLIVGRFNPIPDIPYGRGPAWKMLPAIRTLDGVCRMILEKMDQTIDPAITYVRDGMLDLSEGLEAGRAYPVQPGTKDAVSAIGDFGNLDYGFFSKDELQEAIGRGFYQKPAQKGKTPPSATQVLDERVEQLRRMGRPGASVFTEFVVPMLKRFEFIALRDGKIKQTIVDRTREVAARPISPLVRAQAREQVAQANELMLMFQQTLGEEQAGLLVDGPQTMRAVKEKLGDEIVRVRSEEQIAALIQRLQPQEAPAE